MSVTVTLALNYMSLMFLDSCVSLSVCVCVCVYVCVTGVKRPGDIYPILLLEIASTYSFIP